MILSAAKVAKIQVKINTYGSFGQRGESVKNSDGITVRGARLRA
jgi:hypothetical protein